VVEFTSFTFTTIGCDAVLGLGLWLSKN